MATCNLYILKVQCGTTGYHCETMGSIVEQEDMAMKDGAIPK